MLKSVIIDGMKNDPIELYIDKTLSSFSKITATGCIHILLILKVLYVTNM